MEPVNIQNIALYRYDLPLSSPLNVAGQTMSIRSGIIIELTDPQGNIGYGEVCPLPGLPRESLKECHLSLQNIIPSLLNTQTDINLKSDFLPPSAAFGLDMARLNLLASANGVSSHHILNPESVNTVTVNGLLTRNSLNDLEQIESLINQGYSTIKIKTGVLPVDKEIGRIRSIQKMFKNSISFRLDANRAWTFDDALKFLKSISPDNIEYIEEPLADPNRLPELAALTNIPIALDESLDRFVHPNSPLPDWAGAVVLKPALLGPLARTLLIADKAREQHIKSVITSVFDSGLALHFYSRLAAALSGPNTPAGLDTWRWLEQDTIIPPFKVERGLINLNNEPPALDRTRLQRIDV